LTRTRAAAQIRRVFRAYAIAVRLAYLSAVVVALLFGGWAAVSAVDAPGPGFFAGKLSAGELSWFGLFISCVACAVRALLRPLRRSAFLPETHLRERPVVGTLVALAAAFAGLLVFNVVLAFLQTWPDAGDVNLAGPIALALLLYTFTLLTGEFVLVGRTARIAR
jgi:hypothetical protein